MLADKVKRPAAPYFLSHSVGLQPKTAAATFADGYFSAWSEDPSHAWDCWLETLARFRRNVATLLNSESSQICPQTNISSALTKILFSLPIRTERNKVILAREDFPTVKYVLAQAAKLGLEIEFIESGPHLADPAAWARAFESDVHLVHVTHVFSNLGLKSPVREITRRARENGAITIVDAAQSVGVAPIDLQQWQSDFVTATSVKYLCGGNGAAFMWVNPDLVPALQPIDVGWFSQKKPFDYAIENVDLADDASRFLGGTPSIAPLAIANAGIEMITDAGVHEIEAYNQALLDRLLQALPPQSVISHTAKGERGSSIVVKPRDMAAARRQLGAINAAFDERMGGIRLSVHAYNDENDIDGLAEALDPTI